MALYDQLLGLNQQGLDTGVNIALQRAAQPTMADVFMDRYRQGGQDLMARQKMQMEEDYKNAQLANTQTQRQTQALQTALNYGNKSNIGAIIPYLKQAGIDTSGFNEDTFTGAQQYKADQALSGTRDTNETKWNIALLKDDTSRWLESVKAMKPQDALGKLNWDLHNGIIDPTQYADRYAKINTVINPIAPGLSTQGIAVSPTLQAPPVPLPGFAKGSVASGPVVMGPESGQQSIATTAGPSAPMTSATTSGMVRQPSRSGITTPSTVTTAPQGKRTVASSGTALTPAGSIKLADIVNAKDSAIQGLDKLSRDIEDVMDMPGLSKISGPTGMLYRQPGSGEGYSAYVILQKIKNAGTLGELINLKNSGGTLGQVSNQEGERLERAFAAIDLNQPEAQLRMQLKRVLDDINTSRARINAAAQAKAHGFGATAGEFHPIGETQADSSGNVWRFRGGNYTDRNNWRMVGGGK